MLKRLKPSTRQRFLSISFDFLKPEAEIEVVARESCLEPGRVAPLVRLAGHIRNLSGMDLEEGVSTRLLIYAAALMAGGMGVNQALEAAIIEPLSDEVWCEGGVRLHLTTHRHRADTDALLLGLAHHAWRSW